jgi:CelD/BcsL family acetyltransferase involved in cellulose biosynthesis
MAAGSPRTAALRIDVVRDFERFVALEADWAALAHEPHNGSFFLSHDWFRCCWLSRPEGARPLVLVAREDERVVGLAPLCEEPGRWRGFPVRVMSLLQNQDTPWTGVLLAGERRDATLGAMLDHLARTPGWELLALSKIDRASQIHTDLARQLLGTRHLRSRSGASPTLQLEGDWQSFWERTSQRFKKTVRNVANRIERTGAASIEEMGCSASAPACLELFRAVSARSWKAQLPTSLESDRLVARLFELLTEALVKRGQLLLWVLRIDGAPIAVEYHVQDGDTVVALRSEFDDRYRDASPGAYLNACIIRSYFERGVRGYDMGPGDNEYKRRWATVSRDLVDFRAFRRTPYAAALWHLERKLVPTLRYARDWMRGEDGREPQSVDEGNPVP